MHKRLLLVIFVLSSMQKTAFAQDDDAVLGSTLPSTPGNHKGDSITDDPDPDPVVPAPDPVVPAPVVDQVDPVRSPDPIVNKSQETLPVEPIVPAAKPASSGFHFLEGRRKPASTFGFGVARPASIGKYNHYKYLYGNPRSYPNFYGGYYFGSFLFDVGVIGRMGYYSAQGHPLKSLTGIDRPLKGDLSGQETDSNQNIALTLIPMQLTAEIALSPFKTRWVVFRGWMGLEELFVQETIAPNLPASTTSSSSGIYTSSGWNSGLVSGVMASFSLTGIDARSDYSMRSIGIDRLYLSLFFDLVKTTQAKMGNFDRKQYGIAFSFEGLR